MPNWANVGLKDVRAALYVIYNLSVREKMRNLTRSIAIFSVQRGICNLLCETVFSDLSVNPT